MRSPLRPIPRRRFPLYAGDVRRDLLVTELAWLRWAYRAGALIVRRRGAEVEYRLVDWHPEIEGVGG